MGKSANYYDEVVSQKNKFLSNKQSFLDQVYLSYYTLYVVWVF